MTAIAKSHVLAGVIAIAFSVVGIGALQPKLSTDVHAVKKSIKRDDQSLAPPPEQMRALSFGYRTAAADLMWADLTLEYGLHWQERRAFPDITHYIDAIIALEPSHPLIYQFVDTMLLFTPVTATDVDARVARRYLERGTQERPYDAELWLRYGQFLAFLAPSFLTDEAEIEQWRVAGANAILHAVELGADAARALSALTILRKSGINQVARENLQRLYALTDDADTREQFLLRARQLGESTIAADVAISVVERQWHTRYPFLSRSGALLIGPHRSPSLCAGVAARTRKECPADWSAAIGE